MHSCRQEGGRKGGRANEGSECLCCMSWLHAHDNHLKGRTRSPAVGTPLDLHAHVQGLASQPIHGDVQASAGDLSRTPRASTSATAKPDELRCLPHRLGWSLARVSFGVSITKHGAFEPRVQLQHSVASKGGFCPWAISGLDNV